KMTRLANVQEVEGEKSRLEGRISKLRERARAITGASPNSPLDLLAPHKRAMYGQMIELIYDCSTNRVAAKALVDRILGKIALADNTIAGRSLKAGKRSKSKKLTSTRAGRNSKTGAKKSKAPPG